MDGRRIPGDNADATQQFSTTSAQQHEIVTHLVGPCGQALS
jgi:hypothetical protein